ncbi:hypothetical protein LguiA_033747 [Lonicera macranthoides]
MDGGNGGPAVEEVWRRCKKKRRWWGVWMWCAPLRYGNGGDGCIMVMVVVPAAAGRWEVHVRDLYDEMSREWANVENDSDIQELWDHEWDLQGTISINMYNRGQYFKRVAVPFFDTLMPPKTSRRAMSRGPIEQLRQSVAQRFTATTPGGAPDYEVNVRLLSDPLRRRTLVNMRLLSDPLSFTTTVDVAQSFDHFKLVQRWIPTLCRTNGGKCRVLTIPKRFGIHGLWPENSDGSYEHPKGFDYFKLVQRWIPTLCRTNGANAEYLPFPKDLVSTGCGPKILMLGHLYNEMMREWPDVKNNPNYQVLWQEHEWDLHSTISNNMYNEGQYFKLAVELVKQFPVRNWLSETNIYANDGVPKYNAQNISWAIPAKTLKEPELRCEDNRGANELKEIIICVDLAGGVIDCHRPNKNCFEMSVSFLL